MKRKSFVVAAYFPDSFGGAERQAEILAEALGRQGVDVTLVAPTVAEECPLTELTSFGRIERYRVNVLSEQWRPAPAVIPVLDLLVSREVGTAEFAGVPIYVFPCPSPRPGRDPGSAGGKCTA